MTGQADLVLPTSLLQAAEQASHFRSQIGENRLLPGM